MDNTIDAVIRCIQGSTKTVRVCVPSDDYYREPNDWCREDVTYVCPHALVDALTKLKDIA